MKQAYIDRYQYLGGIEKVFQDFKDGIFTITDISKKTGVSTTSVSNNFVAVFGTCTVNAARKEHRAARKKASSLTKLNAGHNSDLSYAEYLNCLSSGDLKSVFFSTKIKTIIDIARSAIGEPLHIWASFHRPIKIKGKNGVIRIRYATPQKNAAEYKINRYRFKLTPELTQGVNYFIFVITTNKTESYYLIPSDHLNKIQSLNLKFNEHSNSKHASFLVKVENLI